MISRYAQLKASGELRKIRTPRNLTPEEREERAKIESRNRQDKRNAHANAQIRLINAHSTKHRRIIENEAHYLRFDPTFPRKTTEARCEAEALRRAAVVLRYDHSYEYERYYSEELLAIKNGYHNFQNAKRLHSRASRNVRLSLVASAACVIAGLVIGAGTIKKNSETFAEWARFNADSEPEFTTYSGPLQNEEIILGRRISVGAMKSEGGIIYNHAGEIVAMASGMPPVRNDHDGERKPVPSDPTKRCPGFETTLAAYGMFPIETWSYLAWRESRCNPLSQNAEWDENGNMTYHLNKNKTYDTGLLQINSSWSSVVRDICGPAALDNNMSGLKDVDCNLRVARYIMENSQGGLANWRM